MAVPAKAPSLALAAVLVIARDDAESLETPSLCDAVTTAPLALLDALDAVSYTHLTLPTNSEV